MNKKKLVKATVVSAIFIFIAIVTVGSCNNNGNGNGNGSGDEGEVLNGSLRTCDLNGGDSGCKACGTQAACCTLTNPAGCGTIEQIETETTCKDDLNAACKIVQPTPRPPGSSRTITFVNNCGESIWVGGQSINFTALLCETASMGSSPAIGNCGPEGGQGTTIPNNTNWTTAPPWGSDASATWEIPSKTADTTGLQGVRQLAVPDCWDSGSFYARTGCTSGGPGELTCQTANCGSNPGVENCGGINGNKPASLAEFTLNAGIDGNCNGNDNYDVSFVAGYTMVIHIDPEAVADCPSAGTGCASLPECPWDTFVFEPDNPDQIGGFVESSHGEIATCFSPFDMASIGLSPFNGFSTDEQDRLGCVGQYDQSPWVNNDAWGVCMLSLGDTANSCALSAPGTCATNTDVPPLENSTPPCCASTTNFCDPYGQCDTALGRTAAWPEFSDGGQMKASTLYIENIHSTCGDNNGNSDGVYAWAFDDGNQVLGLSNALKACSDQSANYTVTFCAD